MSSENSLSFFGAGGHSHDGSNSTLIDTTRYSIFDFSLGYLGSQARINSQSVRQRSFEDYIVRIINSQVLQPAGLNLDPDTLNGKIIRANTITSTEIQARTITSEEIKAATITANELTSNIVLINNIIRSNNFNGTFHSNGVINNSGTTGWGISHAGSSVFNNVTIRGAIESSSISGTTISGGTISGTTITGGTITIGSSNNVFKADSNGIYLGNATFSSAPFRVTTAGALTATSATISGVLTANAGSIIGPLSVQSSEVSATWDSKIVSIYTNSTWGGGGTVENWAKIGVGVKEPGTALSLLTPRGLYVFSGDTPPFWPYPGVTSLTNGRLNVGTTSGATLTTNANDVDLQFKSASSGIFTSWGKVKGDSTFLEITHPAGMRMQASNANNVATLQLKRSFNSETFDTILLFLNGSNNEAGKIRFDGTATKVSYDTTSDIRVKKDISSILNAMSVVEKINPVSFKYKDTDTIHHGFIAQHLYEVYEKPVYKPLREEDMWSVDYGSLTPILTAALKELNDRVKVLENKILQYEDGGK
jgi:hypothetical protein